MHHPVGVWFRDKKKKTGTPRSDKAENLQIRRNLSSALARRRFRLPANALNSGTG